MFTTGNEKQMLFGKTIVLNDAKSNWTGFVGQDGR